jgi:hypothetical protein
MCWDCNNNDKGDPYKNFRRGGVEVSDFDEVPYRHPPRKKKKKKEKTRPGCPGNDFGPHVYVWTTERAEPDFFSDYYGFSRVQRNCCVGCDKTNGRKASDEYEKIKARKYKALYGNGENQPRGKPVSRWTRDRLPTYRWWAWERHDDDYMAAYKEYAQRQGFPEYLWRNTYFI